MNNFEENGVCVQRLIKEWEEHGRLIIAFDFDNTVYDYHKQGLDLTRIRKAVIEAHRAGHEVYCFTANNDQKFVKEFCKLVLGFEPEINYASIDFGTRKPFYSLFLDDRAGLGSAIQTLETVNQHIKTKRLH